MKKLFDRRLICITLILSALVFAKNSAYAESEMTPYPTYQSPDTFWQGATYILPADKAPQARILHDLEVMKNEYNINCLNIYNLGSLSTSVRDLLFEELKRLGMQVVVRIEGYNSETMNFEEADAEAMITSHSSLIQYVCDSSRRDQVAYFALNIPVDDNTVANNFVTSEYSYGRDNPLWGSSQVTFVAHFVSEMRTLCNSYGFTDAKMYPSVFYGWDHSYVIPSYVSSGADGYFLNNYSYPNGTPPNDTKSDEVLISQSTLQEVMDMFMEQYPTQNKIIESGFHTWEFSGGTKPPNQTAGLVANIAAKQKAVRATYNFYTSGEFTGMKGMQYFGWSLLKEEGNPPDLLDWCLDYPKAGRQEAENNTLYNGTTIIDDTNASNGKIASLESVGDAVAIFNATKSSSVKLVYSSTIDGQISLYIDGHLDKKVILPMTGTEYITLNVNTVIPWGATVKLQYNSGDIPVKFDYFLLEDNNISSSSTMVTTVPEPDLYPNPFTDELNIAIPDGWRYERLKVLDAKGCLIENRYIKGIGSFTIGNNYKQGVYLLQFISDTFIKTEIIIKD